jgi:Secretion system C-terminal sorting domain
MKKLYLVFSCVFYFAISASYAQCTINYLTNPSFETPIQPLVNNNNFPAPYNAFGGWTIPGASPSVPGGGFNIIRVNGSGYSGGPNNAQNGNQYVDINGAAGIVQQSFTVTCGSTLEFSGWFSRREPGGSGFNGSMDIIDGSNNIITSSTVVSFTSNESEETWKQVIGTPVAVVAGTYTIRFIMDDYANIDDAFLCISPGCVLATTLTDFSVKSNKCNADLNWAAADEIDLKNYEVQTSNDGTIFKTIATILPTNASNYSFENKTVSGKSFYRLKLNDKDNTFTYSKIVPVTINCDNVFVSVYPNPVSDILHVNINSNSLSRAVIYNASGKNISTTILQNGDNTINVKNLPNGMYVVKVLSDNDAKVYRINKL